MWMRNVQVLELSQNYLPFGIVFVFAVTRDSRTRLESHYYSFKCIGQIRLFTLSVALLGGLAQVDLLFFT